MIRLGLWLGLSLLGACGHKEAPPVAKLVSPIRSDTVADSSEGSNQKAREVARAASLQCPFPEECDPSVALVSVVTQEGISRCSGVLISEDRVLTNGHCVREVQSSCEEKVFIHFAEVDGVPEHHRGCRAILARSSQHSQGIGMDFAILQLESPVRDRQIAPFASRALEDGESVRIHRVQMKGGKTEGFGGTQEALRCNVALATYPYPLLDSKDFQLTTLGDCAIQEGNSGAPLFNRDGEISGMVQGYLRVSEEEASKTEFRNFLLDSSFGQTAVGTQLGCIPGLPAFSNAPCLAAPPLSGRTPRDFLERNPIAKTPLLPLIEEGFEWKESSVLEPFQRQYVLASSRGDAQMTHGRTLRYRKGINRELRAEWRRVEEEDGVERP